MYITVTCGSCNSRIRVRPGMGKCPVCSYPYWVEVPTPLVPPTREEIEALLRRLS